jgi:hypothetical protein
MTDDLSSTLISELTAGPGDAVAREAAVALGAPPSNPFDAVPELDAYYIDYSDADVLRIYMVSAGRLVRHEHARDGGYLTTLVGLDRVRRVFEEGRSAGLQVGIELEADQSSLRLVPEPVRAADGSPDPGGAVSGAFDGVVVHAGWVLLAADPAVRERLAAFSAQLRLLLAV